MEEEELAFTVIERSSGKTYKIYLSGKIEGFEGPCSVFNYIPLLIISYRSASGSKAASPSKNTSPEVGGESQGTELNSRMTIGSTLLASGEK